MFSNRITAAYKLVPLLKKYEEHPGGLVLAVARVGVPIAYIMQ